MRAADGSGKGKSGRGHLTVRVFSGFNPRGSAFVPPAAKVLNVSKQPSGHRPFPTLPIQEKSNMQNTPGKPAHQRPPAHTSHATHPFHHHAPPHPMHSPHAPHAAHSAHPAHTPHPHPVAETNSPAGGAATGNGNATGDGNGAAHAHYGAHAQKTRNPLKAYDNPDFVHGPYGRSVRVLSEMTEPQQRINRHRIRNTVVFFGSARLLSAADAERRLRAAEEDASGAPEERAKRIERARRAVNLSVYYEAARQLAGDVTRWSKTLPKPLNPFFVCSGGGPGIMEAANRGASESGGVTLGLGISLPYEQTNNPYITQGLSFEFHYFFVRKYWFVSLARAVVAFPGGFGTIDELFELLTLIQTGKAPRVPVILFGSEYWRNVLNFELFKNWGLIDDEDLDIFHIVDTVEEARELIFQGLTRFCQESEMLGNGTGGGGAGSSVYPSAMSTVAPPSGTHGATAVAAMTASVSTPPATPPVAPPTTPQTTAPSA